MNVDLAKPLYLKYTTSSKSETAISPRMDPAHANLIMDRFEMFPSPSTVKVTLYCLSNCLLCSALPNLGLI